MVESASKNIALVWEYNSLYQQSQMCMFLVKLGRNEFLLGFHTKT